MSKSNLKTKRYERKDSPFINSASCVQPRAWKIMGKRLVLARLDKRPSQRKTAINKSKSASARESRGGARPPLLPLLLFLLPKNQLLRKDGAGSGWIAIKAGSGLARFPVTYTTLFPVSKLDGWKVNPFFSNKKKETKKRKKRRKKEEIYTRGFSGSRCERRVERAVEGGGRGMYYVLREGIEQWSLHRGTWWRWRTEEDRGWSSSPSFISAFFLTTCCSPSLVNHSKFLCDLSNSNSILRNEIYIPVPIIPDYLCTLDGNSTGDGDENGRVGLLLSSKALVQLILNPAVGTFTGTLGYAKPLLLGNLSLLLAATRK